MRYRGKVIFTTDYSCHNYFNSRLSNKFFKFSQIFVWFSFLKEIVIEKVIFKKTAKTQHDVTWKYKQSSAINYFLIIFHSEDYDSLNSQYAFRIQCCFK